MFFLTSYITRNPEINFSSVIYFDVLTQQLQEQIAKLELDKGKDIPVTGRGGP
jgi:hypothetical protein